MTGNRVHRQARRNYTRKFSHLAVAGLLTVSQAQGASDTLADTVLSGGRIYTANPAQPWAESVAIRNGKIVGVGSTADNRDWIGPHTEVVSLDGKFVTPGLIDGHTHPGILSLFAANDLAVAPQSDTSSLLSWLTAYAESNPQLPFIVAGFWQTADFGLAGPNKALLDSAVSDRPVALLDDSGHSMWLNSKALAALGIDANTEDPAPGLAYFERGPGNEPTGWIKEFASAPVQERLLQPTDQQSLQEFEQKLEEFLYYLSSTGVTSLYDGGNLWMHDTVYSVLAKLDRENRLPIKYEGTVHIHLPQQIDHAIDELKRLRAAYSSERLQFNTIKIHFDGVHEIRTSAVLEGFADQPANRGGTLVSQQRLTQFIGELHREKLDLHLHVVGDRATRIALDAYEDALKTGWDYPRLTLCHLELVADEDIPRFRELSVVANFTPQWFGDIYQGGAKTLGARNDQKMRARSFFDAGATVTFSSDVVAPVEATRAAPVFGIQTGVTRQEPYQGRQAYTMKPVSERLDVEQLLQGYTINGAWQLRQSQQRGSLEVGKAADLVIFSANLFDIDPYSIADTYVVGTLVDGQFIERPQRRDSHE